MSDSTDIYDVESKSPSHMLSHSSEAAMLYGLGHISFQIFFYVFVYLCYILYI